MAQNSNIFFDELDFIKKLRVGIGEVSEITGVPQRQIRYWESKGIIQSTADEASKTRRYQYLDIKKIVLIKELLDEGYTLNAAAEKLATRMQAINDAFARLMSKPG